MFFYDKGFYLFSRYEELIQEMKARGMNPDPDRIFKTEQWPDDLFNDWTPTLRDQVITRIRITEKLAQKPGWYRKTPHVEEVA